jgi:ApaG protein
MNTVTAMTEGVKVVARPIYLDGQSDVVAKKFVFAYFIRIENTRAESVQLLRRHWYITDARGITKEVEGEGVIGQKPVIFSGTAHEYSSFCILQTFEGSMEGTYLMQSEDGEQFKIAIPRFTLRAAAN